MNVNTQLTSAKSYNTDCMVFSDPQVGSIPNSTPAISFKRINIQTKNPDGTIGELIIPTSTVFSFGLGENLSMDSGKVNGYVMPLCLWNKDGPTEEEKEWTNTFDKIVQRCKEHLVENREDIEQYDLEMTDLKKLNPLYWKKERGKVVPGTGPTLYTKVISSKKHGKIVTQFYDFDGEMLDPLTIMKKYCYARAAIKIESIFIGNKISLQVKLYECEVKLVEMGMKRLLSRPKANNRVLTSTPVVHSSGTTGMLGETSDSEIVDDDESETAVEDKPKKIIKRRVKRAKKSSE